MSTSLDLDFFVFLSSILLLLEPSLLLGVVSAAVTSIIFELAFAPPIGDLSLSCSGDGVTEPPISKSLLEEFFIGASGVVGNNAFRPCRSRVLAACLAVGWILGENFDRDVVKRDRGFQL